VPVFLSHFNEASNFTPFFEKHSNIKFHENPPTASRVVLWGQKDGQTDRQINITKLIVAFRYFANAPKQIYIIFTLSFFSALLRLSVYSTPKILRMRLLSPATFYCGNNA